MVNPIGKLEPKTSGRREMDSERLSSIMRVSTVIWSGVLLTVFYMGGLKELDSTFIAGLFTQSLASFGVTLHQSKKKPDEEPPTNKLTVPK